MRESAERRPLLNVNLRWFLLAMILANIAGQMAYSMLSLYLIDLGASVSQVGLVFTVASLVPTILQLFGGWLSDTIGRLRAIAIGSSVAVLGYLLFFISPSWELVMVGLCVEYVSNSFVGPSFSAYIAEQSEEANRGRVFGVTKSIYMVVTVAGPALAGFISQRLGFKPMLLIAFFFYLAATGVRIWMSLNARFTSARKPQKPTFPGFRTEILSMLGLLLSGGVLTWIWITDAINDTSYNLVGQLFPLYLSGIGHLNLEQIGGLNSIWGAASIVASYLGGWLTDRFRERTIIACGFSIIALGLVVMLQAGDIPIFALSMFLYGFGVGGLMPAYDSLISKTVPEEKRGLAFGFFGTSLGILSLPFPWIGAQLWERFSPQVPFWITAAACSFSILLAWNKFKTPRSKS